MHHLNTAMRLYLSGLLLFGISLLLPAPFQAGGLLLATGLSGYHVTAEGLQDTLRASRQHRQFTPNIHLLMFLAAFGAILIGSFREAALLMLIFAGAHFLEEYAEGKSNREITALLDLNPVEARRLTAQQTVELVSVADLAVGDRLQVLNGDQVPTDGTITQGTAVINEATITGESLPREKQVGDAVYGSTLNGDSSFQMVVTKTSQETTFAQIVALVQHAQTSLGTTATWIERFEPRYVKVVLALIPLVFLTNRFLLDWTLATSLYRTIVFLIAASPCALAAAAVPATLSGLSNLAKQGVLFKGGHTLTELSDLQAIAFDKTGTLTQGQPQVTDVSWAPTADPVTLTNLLVAMERQSNHPLATAITAHFTPTEPLPLAVTNTVGIGLQATYHGQVIAIGKPTAFPALPVDVAQTIHDLTAQGKTIVLLAVDQQIQLLIALMDRPAEHAAATITYFNQQQIHTELITGDTLLTGQAIGRQLQVQHVSANTLPASKAALIAAQQRRFKTVAMVGDGVNDAPALAQANIGIAMGGGTDVAIDVADMVLMTNDLTKLTTAHRLSRRLQLIVRENLVLALIVVALLIVLNFLQLTDIAWGVVLHEGSTLVVILNGLRLLLFK
ncbi:heavy metal translocating P-type ATPase [Levilactobacillus zymae]|uniref:Lead, cadmium, zinc and mercury transporting ATPase / Copper-translocating P-type ATPase n=1 Tax=Levilactobacillus zymae TaxID=267363 RepID=A0A1Y6JU87_9LACO|nr:heavy metal translocating P-type ATPase [Levilactobacillus zymae]SMS13516.1 Lead, cadmium, zinc and mercury transporting ATPase / Copper-translocating P-type ATPase [Levilactobacillus zymae]